MAENRSYRAGLEDFRRYQQGEMSAKEQHLLEKQMLDDPMLAEAYEGFLAMQRTNTDLAKLKLALDQNLQKRIIGRQKRTIPLWIYGAAASLIVSLGTVWILLISKPQKGDMRENGQYPVEKPLIDPAPPTTPEPDPETALPVEKPVQRTEPAARHERKRELAKVIPEQQPETDLAATDRADQTTIPASAPLEKQAFANTARTPVPTASGRPLQEKPKYKKSQTVVSESVSARSLAASPVLADSVTNLTASPLMGWDAFNVYLDKQTGAARRRGVVEVSFHVNADGTLTDFTAQGKKQLQAEAIRIVKEGPLWVPARQNGFAFRTHTTVKLQFKK